MAQDEQNRRKGVTRHLDEGNQRKADNQRHPNRHAGKMIVGLRPNVLNAKHHLICNVGKKFHMPAIYFLDVSMH